MCALFGRVSQSEDLFLRTRAGKHRRDQWISARVVAAIDLRLHAHRAIAEQTAQVFRLARRNRETEQRRAAFDGAERALASEQPFETRGIFRCENELALYVEALEIGRSLQFDDFRDHAV